MLTETKRLSLDRPTAEDVAGLHEIFSDPRVWTHIPTQRHSSLEKTRVMLESWNPGMGHGTGTHSGRGW